MTSALSLDVEAGEGKRSGGARMRAKLRTSRKMRKDGLKRRGTDRLDESTLYS